jgi:hypothetical protein
MGKMDQANTFILTETKNPYPLISIIHFSKYTLCAFEIKRKKMDGQIPSDNKNLNLHGHLPILQM